MHELRSSLRRFHDITKLEESATALGGKPRHTLQFEYHGKIDMEHLETAARKQRFRFKAEHRQHGTVVRITEGTRRGVVPVTMVLDNYPILAKAKGPTAFFSIQHSEPELRKTTRAKLVKLFRLMHTPRAKW